MIQDIYPERLFNQYKKAAPGPMDSLAAFRGNKIFLRRGERAAFLKWGELSAWCGERGEAEPESVYLFSIGGERFFLAELPEGFEEEMAGGGCTTSPASSGSLDGVKKEIGGGGGYVRMFEVRSIAGRREALAAATAYHLYTWYRDSRFCGRCGGRLVHHESIRMMRCPDCGFQAFPKISPAVIVALVDGDRILLTTYAGREYKRYALIAGFAEIGETAEETVKREVMEEVGLSVKNIRYYKSQPWGFDSDLLLGYVCELDGSPEIRLDHEELSSAEWVRACDVPGDEEGLSLTGEMMAAFRDGRLAP